MDIKRIAAGFKNVVADEVSQNPETMIAILSRLPIANRKAILNAFCVKCGERFYQGHACTL